ncbi:MAG: bifunctional (p)ppGpp synthetase/guanosine-3',5'-bis(diphosphate) 3'-pyrophosphohydrolase [Gammaproteobacteria bacterium]|nr:bifunctional (p)ppGpp synthetase/guanosine-3',5'-bis(diphosphate) 3'-pyrophosphohydrolase [Gammaproteobacteria bacterium]
MQIRPLRRSPPGRARPLAGFLPQRRTLIDELCELLEQYLDEQAVDDVYRAYLFGAEAHEGQTRLSGEPYISHPLQVASILALMRLDSRSIIAAILHDVIEDTPTAKEQLVQQFGEDVAHLVDGVSKISQLDFDSKEEAEAENYRKMLLAMSRDIRVILIKLADRLHNMRTLDALRPKKRQSIARQTLDIYAPIANRLGMHEWGRELEDLSFLHLFPKRYRAISKALKRRQGNRKAVVKKLRTAMESHFEQSGLEARVVGREKNVYSIYKKMQSKRCSFDQIQDIYGFRLLVQEVDDCYRALGIVHNLYKPIPGRFKDYVAIPKANGYQSLHTVVFGAFGETLEVQIRTENMHRIAHAGVAAHWLYKTEDSVDIEPQQLARQWMLDLLDTQHQAGNPTEFLEHLKIDLFPDEVYVFTPKGDIKKLPQGATTLDFAYAVHTDIGNRCIGSRVNHELVPLNTVLRSGDHVEIMTSRSGRPSPSWLNYAITGKARATIRSFLKNQRRKESVRLGKRLLDRALKNIGHSSKKIKPDQKQSFLESLKLTEWDDLLEDIGLGKRLPSMVARQLVPRVEGGKEHEGGGMQPLAIHGAEGMLITYARCCRPVPGDPIIGFLSAGRGIVVHTSDCPNNSEYRKHPDKWIDIHWDAEVTGDFPVNIRVDSKNKPGVLAKLAAVIAEQGSNIDSVSLIERDGQYSTIGFTIEVKDHEHLDTILEQLRAQSGAVRVARVKG